MPIVTKTFTVSYFNPFNLKVTTETITHELYDRAEAPTSEEENLLKFAQIIAKVDTDYTYKIPFKFVEGDNTYGLWCALTYDVRRDRWLRLGIQVLTGELLQDDEAMIQNQRNEIIRARKSQ